MKVSELYKELSRVSYTRFIGLTHPIPEHVCNLCGHKEDEYTYILEHIFTNHKDETIPDVDPVEAI